MATSSARRTDPSRRVSNEPEGPGVPGRCRTWTLVHAEHAVGREPRDARLAAQGHIAPQLVAKDREGVLHAFRAADRETPQRGTPDRDHPRAPGDALQHRRAAAEAAVDDDLRAITDDVGDRRQRVDRRLRRIELTSAV